jgi:hypothetical protein
VISRCGNSEREFYDVFRSADECVLTTFDAGVGRLSRVVANTVSREDNGLERVRAGLVSLLSFLDEEPCWARYLILDPPTAPADVLERRRRALAALARALEAETEKAQANEIQDQALREHERAGSESSVRSSALTAELIVGGIFSVLRTRMLESPRGPFVELAPALMAFIMVPYHGFGSSRDVQVRSGTQPEEDGSRRERLPVRATYRTTRVLSAIGASPRLSNREIADAAGLSDEGQTSRLLRRLEQRGLVQNVGLGQPWGEANAWLLTANGERVLHATRHSLAPGAGAVMGRRIRGAA